MHGRHAQAVQVLAVPGVVSEVSVNTSERCCLNFQIVVLKTGDISPHFARVRGMLMNANKLTSRGGSAS